MKKKIIPAVSENDFNNIYCAKEIKNAESWKELFANEIALFSSFSTAHSFWYIGDFSTAQVVALGGDFKHCTPLSHNKWIGINPMEIGQLMHPADVSKMQSFTHFISNFLSKKSEKERGLIKITMLFRMMDAKRKYTWRLMQYPKVVYKSKFPQYIFCQITTVDFLINMQDAKSTMYIIDNNTKDGTMFYCEDEKIDLKPFENHEALSKREHDVLKLIAKGLASKEIAAALKISKNTVENHKQKIFAKTGIKKVTELIVYANKYFAYN
jgi:DNA-binding CsgD family transcriptional regulator